MNAIPINWEIVANPVNWLTIILMLVIFGFLVHEILPQLNKA